MNLSTMTTTELIDLIREASTELAARIAAPIVDRVPDERPRVTMRVPADDDKDFILRLKTTVTCGGYVTASDRQRVANLSVDFGTWIKLQGLPTTKGAGDWRRMAERYRIKPAVER